MILRMQTKAMDLKRQKTKSVEAAAPVPADEQTFKDFTNDTMTEHNIRKSMMLTHDEFNEFFHKNKQGQYVMTTAKD